MQDDSDSTVDEHSAALLASVDTFMGTKGAVTRHLEAGADPNVRNEHGLTPLIIAAVRGNEVGTKELLDGGAEVDLTTEHGTTALMLAAREDEWDVVPLLLRGGAEVDRRDGDGWTALMYAAYADAKSAATKLLSADTDVHATTTTATTLCRSPSSVARDAWSSCC